MSEMNEEQVASGLPTVVSEAVALHGDCTGLFKALLAAKREFKAVEKSAENPHFRSAYVPLSEFKAMADPVLHEHGLLVMQPYSLRLSDAVVLLTTMIVHAESGAMMVVDSVMPCGELKPQAVGSAITYAQRYQYKGLLGLRDTDDDDGERAEGRTPARVETLSDAQATSIEAKIVELGADKAAFCRYLGVRSISDIPASRYDYAMKALDRKAEALPKKGGVK